MVALAVVVVVLQEEVLVCAVAGERNGRDAQAGEQALEAVDSAEGAGVAPGLTEVVSREFHTIRWVGIVLSSPGVSLGVDRVGRGRGLEFLDVEAGGVLGGHGGLEGGGDAKGRGKKN